MLLNAVFTAPVGPLKPKILLDEFNRNFLQYEEDPAENSASFAFERFKFFSRIVPAFPVISPSSSITTTCTSSNLEFLAAAYAEVPGLSAT